MNVNVEVLKQYVERLESLESEKKGLMEDVKELKIEMKNRDIDPKAVSTIVKLRAMDRGSLDRMDDLIDSYRKALNV